MTFLQPYIFWGLPLVLVPVLIHLLNRLRHRSVSWAAMSFLLAATRQLRRQAKLRHWLVLLCRVLAVTALLLALARPLVGGWLGWAMSGAPETVILLLDRSASMELQDPQTHASKRQVALQRLAAAARSLGAAARLVLIESAGRVPQEITPATLVSDSPLVAATDTAADLPAMLEAAVDYVLANQCGQTEFWLASDLQASNWHPESPRWPALAARIGSLPQEVRVRLLALTADVADNLAVAVTEVRRHELGDKSRLDLTIDISRRATMPITFPLSVVVAGERSLVNVRLDGQQVRLHHQIDLGGRHEGGWGAVELPPDANARDNVAYFAFNPDVTLRAVVVSDDAALGRSLQLATVPAPALLNQSCQLVRTADAEKAVGKDTALVVWVGALPWTTAVALPIDRAQGLREPDPPGVGWLRRFVESGGVVIAFPPGGTAEEGRAKSEERDGVTTAGDWGEVEVAPAAKPFRVTSWRGNEGPLAATEAGTELPVNDLTVSRRRVIRATGTVLGSFADGKPFLVRPALGQGASYFCATLPQAGWSNLGDGLVLVPMLQRLLQDGGQRLGDAVNGICGEQRAAGADFWTRLDKPGHGRWEAGAYRVGERLVALNRPPAEDAIERLDEAAVRHLFGPVRLRFFAEKVETAGRLQSEAWRMCVGALVLLLLAEGWLTLTAGTVGTAGTAGTAGNGHTTGTRTDRGDAVPPNDQATVRGRGRDGVRAVRRDATPGSTDRGDAVPPNDGRAGR